MNGTSVRWSMLDKLGRFWRAGYPPDAPRQGHLALVALCSMNPSAARVVRLASSRGAGDCRP